MSKIGLMILCTWYFSHALHCRNVDLDNWSTENDEFFTVLSICFLPETQIFSLKQEGSFCDNVMLLSFCNIAIPLQKMEKMFIEMYFLSPCSIVWVQQCGKLIKIIQGDA